MKTILIEQVANGWIVRGNDPAFIATRCKTDFHVYRSIKELQAELPDLLADHSTPAPTPEEIRESRKKLIDEKFPTPLMGSVHGA